jgi:hypothetical protein
VKQTQKPPPRASDEETTERNKECAAGKPNESAAVGALCTLSASDNRSTYLHDLSLMQLVIVDTQYIYGMQYFCYWQMPADASSDIAVHYSPPLSQRERRTF